MSKEKYYDVELEIIRFDNQDVITESQLEDHDGGGVDDPNAF